jgi:GNAT superfamily N-acetyltransferase
MPNHPTLVFREIAHADIPALFFVRTRTRENTYTLDQLRSLGITPESVGQWLAGTCKGWLCEEAGAVVGFCIADHSSGELLVIAVLPQAEGKGVGGTILGLAEDWLWRQGCTRAWLTTDVDPSRRAYGFYRRRGWADWKLQDGMRYMQLLRPASAVQAPVPA